MSLRSTLTRIGALFAFFAAATAVAGDFEPRLGLDEDGYPRKFTYEEILAITPRFDGLPCLIALQPTPRSIEGAARLLDRMAAYVIKQSDFAIGAKMQAAYFEGVGVQIEEGLRLHTGYAAYETGAVRSGVVPIVMDSAVAKTRLFSRLLLIHELTHMAHYELWHAEEVRISLASELEFLMATELVAHRGEFAMAAAIPFGLWAQDVEEGVSDEGVRAAFGQHMLEARDEIPLVQRLEEVAANYMSGGMGVLDSLTLTGHELLDMSAYYSRRTPAEYVRLFLEQGVQAR